MPSDMFQPVTLLRFGFSTEWSLLSLEIAARQTRATFENGFIHLCDASDRLLNQPASAPCVMIHTAFAFWTTSVITSNVPGPWPTAVAMD